MTQQFYKNVLIIMVLVLVTSCQHWKISKKGEERVPHYPESTVVSIDNFPNSIQTILEAKGTSRMILDYYTKNMHLEGWKVLLQRDNFLAFSRDGEGAMIDLEGVGQNKKKIIISYLAETNDFQSNM